MTISPSPSAISSTHLPGRETELDQLRSIIDRVRSKAPQWVAVEGAPGMGKTALVDATLTELPDWRRIIIELDPADAAATGTLLQQLLTGLTGHRGITVPDTVPECVRTVLDIIDATDGLTVVVVENLQWADAWSTEVLWQVARGLTWGRSLVLMTYRPHGGELPQRVDQFLESGRRGLKLNLGPLAQAACRQLLEDRLGVAVSEDIARRVHQGTHGAPFLVNMLADWLMTAPPDKRRVQDALAVVVGEGQGFPRALDLADLSRIEDLPDCLRDAIRLLAVARIALPLPHLERALERLGHSALPQHLLLGTELMRFDSRTGDVVLAQPYLSAQITAHLTADERAGLHRALVSVLTGPVALQHRVKARLLAPQSASQDALLAELVDLGMAALNRQDGKQAFEHFRHALWLTDDTRMLALALRAAVVARRPELVVELRAHLPRLPASRPRHAAQTWVWLVMDNVEVAASHIMTGLDLPDDDPEHTGLMLLGHALGDVGRASYAKGLFEVTVQPIDALLARLRPVRLQLEQAVRLDPRVSTRLAEAQSLEALMALWSGLRHGDRAAAGEHAAAMRMLLAELEPIPGTEVVKAAIGGAVGATLLAHGDVAEASQLLQAATVADPADRVLGMQVESHRGQLAFQAGDWDVAQSHFGRAVEKCLLLPTTAAVRSAYAAAALVPLARGDRRAGSRLLARAQDDGIAAGDLVDGGVALALAVGALFAGDHREAARQFETIDAGRTGWTTVGFTGMVLYARELALTGGVERLESLAAVVDVEAAAVPEGMRRILREAVSGFLAVALGRVPQARWLLTSCLETLDAEPEAPCPGAHSTRLAGGGHALVRAFVALDLAVLGLQQESSASQDEEALGWARQAAEFFLRTGSRRQHDEVVKVTASLRRRLALAPQKAAPRPTTAGPDAVTGPVVPPAGMAAFDPAESAMRLMEALSAREREIAVEVADGKSNREIATEMFLSVRTVEFHVGNCLSKLGLTSRVDLRRALRAAHRPQQAAPAVVA